MDITSLNRDITENKHELEIDPLMLEALQYKNFKEAGLDMLYTSALSRLSMYEHEVQHYERKYNASFEDFSELNSKKKNLEDFEEEDDLMAWQFAHENYIYWREKVREIKSCLANI